MTIHDLIHLRYPEFLPHRLALALRAVDAPPRGRGATRVIAPSRGDGGRPRRAGRCGPGAPPGDPERGRRALLRRPRRRIRSGDASAPRPWRRYLLFVGNPKPHKNLEDLVRAFGAALPRLPPDVRLVLVGERGDRARWHRLAAAAGAAGRIDVLGSSTTPSCRRSSAVRSRSSFRRSTRASACRWSKRWRRGRRSSRLDARRSRRSPATRHCSSTAGESSGARRQRWCGSAGEAGPAPAWSSAVRLSAPRPALGDAARGPWRSIARCSREHGRPRVALVHDWLTGQRGGENVLVGDRPACAARRRSTPSSTFPARRAELESHPIVTSFLQHAPLLERRYRHYLPLFPAAMASPRYAPRIDCSSSLEPLRRQGGPAGSGRLATLCYCHTPMRYVWDQRRAYFPRPRARSAGCASAILDAPAALGRRTAGRVDLYLANSHFVADRIRALLRPRAPRCSRRRSTPTSTARSTAPRERFVLMVAALAPYKKVDAAIEACAAAGAPLVIVGDGPERPSPRSARRPRRPASRAGVERAGAARPAVRGRRLLSPAGIEDFGIATVEALACGTPVLALGEGGVLDIVESGRRRAPPGSDDPEADALAGRN